MDRFIAAVRREWVTIVLVGVGFFVGRASLGDAAPTGPPAAALRSDTAFVTLEHGGTVFCRPVELLNHLFDDIVAVPTERSFLWGEMIYNALPALAAVDDETCRLEGARALVAALHAYHKTQADADYEQGFADGKAGDRPFAREAYDSGVRRNLADVATHASYLKTFAAAQRAGL